MEAAARGVRVQIIVGESEQVGHRPRYQAILEYLRREGAAGATVVRGIAGFGANSRIKTATILRLSLDLPVIVVWVDAPERVERLLPGLRDLAGSGIITVEEVGIAGYGGRRLEQLRFDLQVRDVMRRDVTSIRSDAPVREAVAVLVGREFRALPVVDPDGRLVGILANTDLLERGGLAMRLELLSAVPEDVRSDVLAGLPDRPVHAVMTANPVTLAPGDTLALATRRMSERHLKRLPVVDEAGRLVGILSRADILHAVAESFPRATTDRGIHPGARTVGELMRSDGPVVSVDAPLGRVVESVASTRLNRTIVVDADRRVVGVVSDADVLASAEPASRPGVVAALMRSGGVAAGSATARDVMRPHLPTLPADATLAEAARLMATHRWKVLAVVDGDGRLLGVVDRADLLHAASGALAEISGEAIEDEQDEDEE